MKALPERFSERTIVATCDKTVSFTVRPLDNRVITHINSQNIEQVSERNPIITADEAALFKCEATTAADAVNFTDAKSIAKFHEAMNDLLWKTKVSEWRVNPVGGQYDEIAFGLVDLKGVEDFELEFETLYLGREKYKKVKHACIQRFPHSLYLEILGAIRESNNLTQEEAENVNFTPASSMPESTAPETSEHACADAET